MENAVFSIPDTFSRIYLSFPTKPLKNKVQARVEKKFEKLFSSFPEF